MKAIIAALLTFGMAAAASAQQSTAVAESSSSSPSRAIRRVMPQAHVIYDQFNGSDSSSVNNQQGFDAGALFDIGTAEHLVLETGALYRHMNFQGTGTFLGTADFTEDFISIPVAAKVYFKGQDFSSLYLKLGGMASVLAQRNVNYSSAFSGNAYDLNGTTWQFAALGGLGYKFILTPASDLFVEANYTQDLQSAFNNLTVYRAAWNFGAGFGINL